jgi:tRNA threonylcarbamoyladenosine biosynthesis protein TsaB
MKLLAIDTSTEMASVALCVGDDFLCEDQPGSRSHAQLLLPIIHGLLSQADVSINQLDAIVFGRGPGSFTGLRIACSIAKGLAYAHDLGVIPVSSLAAIAYAVREKEKYAKLPVLAVLDARMHELYWGYFPVDSLFAEDKLQAASAIKLPSDKPLLLAGVGFEPYVADLPKSLTAHISTQIDCYPSAAAMIRLAMQAKLKPIAAASAEPVYVRNQVTQGDSRG